MSFIDPNEPVNIGINKMTDTVTFEYNSGNCNFEIKPTNNGRNQGWFTINNDGPVKGYKTAEFTPGDINVISLSSTQGADVNYYTVKLSKKQGVDLNNIFIKPLA